MGAANRLCTRQIAAYISQQSCPTDDGINGASLFFYATHDQRPCQEVGTVGRLCTQKSRGAR